MKIELTLKSDACFSNGRSTAGAVDVELDFEPDTGIPFIRGSVVKGLLVESCSVVLASVRGLVKSPLVYGEYLEAAAWLIGRPGTSADATGFLEVDRASVSPELRSCLRQAQRADDERSRILSPDRVLEALTVVRSQTAIDSTSGIAKTGSLRTLRLVRRELVLEAPLMIRSLTKNDVPERCLALLNASIRMIRRGGIHRTRGLGRLECHLLCADVKDPDPYLAEFFQSLDPA